MNLKHLKGALLALIVLSVSIIGLNPTLWAEQGEKVPSLSAELEGIADINQVQPMSDYERRGPLQYDTFPDLIGDDNRVISPRTFEGGPSHKLRFRSD